MKNKKGETPALLIKSEHFTMPRRKPDKKEKNKQE
jgi:hypothetical protein